jgi:hypothetical protein
MLRIVVSLTIVILTTLEVSFMLLVFNYAPREHLYIVQASLLMIVNYDHDIFIAQAIGANVTKLLTSVINKCL